MGRMTDVEIRNWVATGERFDQRSDGDGLTLSFRTADKSPRWLFRYRFGGKQRIVFIGRYPTMTLAQARKEVKQLSARVVQGHDVAAEKQARKADALAAIEAENHKVTVASVTDEFFERMVIGKGLKRAHVIRQRLDKDLVPTLGKMEIGAVKPRDIDAMLQTILKRDVPSIANNVLSWTQRIFTYAVKRHLCESNPAAVFDLSDAGGKAVARDRALSRTELVALFEAMRTTAGFGRENQLAVKLLLLLAVRKQELLAAKWDEFDLDAAVWRLSAERTKTDADIAIPLSPAAIASLWELQVFACGSAYLFPARKAENRRLLTISEATLNRALLAVEKNMPNCEHFTVHDLRRTARTQLAALGVPPHIAEKCLNHKLKGVEGRYDRFDYFEERRQALKLWAQLLTTLEAGGADVIPLHERRTV